ncbi:MAG: hypothetical protein K2V38_00980 [Gemmataceae bacterium]|nr:hypothetical protein [Gemmataceae bacterium]
MSKLLCGLAVCAALAGLVGCGGPESAQAPAGPDPDPKADPMKNMPRNSGAPKRGPGVDKLPAKP